MIRKLPHIMLPEDRIAVQAALPFNEERLHPFPPIDHGQDAVLHLARHTREYLGLDLEFNSKTLKPSIIGVANQDRAASCGWDEATLRAVISGAFDKKYRIVGHAIVGADKAVIEKALDTTLPSHLWLDTMLLYYLLNADFAKAPAKTEDEDDATVRGLMNLWCMASLYTDLPSWKNCRGRLCLGPCPRHNVWDYCAIDAYAPVKALSRIRKEAEEKNVPFSLLEGLAELDELCARMTSFGILIDKRVVKEVEQNLQKQKEELFKTQPGNKKIYELFNPNSPKNILAWFKTRGISLERADKDAIQKAAERLAAKYKVSVSRLDDVALSDAERQLTRLLKYKSIGKGTKSWLSNRYVASDNCAHPRFVVAGTSTGRLSSSGPNFQNIGRHGQQGEMRRALVARPEWDFLAADYNMLELRMVLWLAGEDPRKIPLDIFDQIVVASVTSGGTNMAELAAQKAAKGVTARDVVKTIAYGACYGEGLRLVQESDLLTKRVQDEINSGALRLYPDWYYRGSIVGFTGANLAERVLGSKSWENRRQVILLQEDVIFGRFPQIRSWQKQVFQEVEARGYVRRASGRFLNLYTSPEDDAKDACAFYGQGTAADYVQAVMLRYKREGLIASSLRETDKPRLLLQIHDDLTFEIPVVWSNQQAKDFLAPMSEETEGLPGFCAPIKAKRGRNLYGMLAI